MEDSPVACMRQSSCCLPCNFSLARASGTNLARRSSFGTTSLSTSRTVARASTTACPGSICSPPSSSTGMRPSRRSGQTAKTRGADSRARALAPDLTPWVGPHPARRLIPVAEAPIASLAYDSAPYLSRAVYENPWSLFPVPRWLTETPPHAYVEEKRGYHYLCWPSDQRLSLVLDIPVQMGDPSQSKGERLDRAPVGSRAKARRRASMTPTQCR